MGLRPFRFGVQLSSATGAAAWRDRARRAEDLGYSTVWMPDHFDDQWGPMVGLTAVAAATSTVRIGALVFDNDYRHPGVVAKEMATLDIVSEGRVEFGIGAGWLRSDYDEMGLAYDAPAVRIDRLEEAVRVIKALWSGERTDLDGHHYRLRQARGRPRPVQQPHPPILIAGGGRRVLGLAAREADIVGFNMNLASGWVGPEAARSAVAERFRERVRWVREAAGGRLEHLEFHCNASFCMVGADRDAMAAAMAPGFGITADEALAVPVALVGSVEQICASLEERREQYGFSYWGIPGDACEAFGPVVNRMAGR